MEYLRWLHVCLFRCIENYISMHENILLHISWKLSATTWNFLVSILNQVKEEIHTDSKKTEYGFMVSYSKKVCPKAIVMEKLQIISCRGHKIKHWFRFYYLCNDTAIQISIDVIIIWYRENSLTRTEIIRVKMFYKQKINAAGSFTYTSKVVI